MFVLQLPRGKVTLTAHLHLQWGNCCRQGRPSSGLVPVTEVAGMEANWLSHQEHRGCVFCPHGRGRMRGLPSFPSG